MTLEEKELLLKDLCARLPYGVKGAVEIEVSTGEYSIESGHLLFMEKEIAVELLGINKETEEIEVYPLNDINLDGYDYVINDFIPYLRPMSSMTKEERKEKLSFFQVVELNSGLTPLLSALKSFEYINWLNAHHFDYRGLIEKGLVLEAPKDMYK